MIASTRTAPEEIQRIVRFEEANPATLLGPRSALVDGREVLSVRAYLPRASRAWIELEGRRTPMTEVGGTGFYEVRVDVAPGHRRYLVGFADASGYEEVREDPYSFGPYVTEYDIHLFGEGTQRRAYGAMGAHVVTREGVEGVQFVVWAPNALSVAVVGDFNHWRVGAHPMSSRGPSGIWELFVPRLRPSELYKFAIKTKQDGRVVTKTDPYAFSAQLRPDTAAIVANMEYAWGDREWMSSIKGDGPMSIYEVHLGSWKRADGHGSSSGYLSYRELADTLIPYVKQLGFTHIELMPVMEHPLDDSWGYQVVNYYAPTSRHGEPADFKYFIDLCHRSGIGVILDWVPGHFPSDEHGIARFDGTHLYEHADPRKGVHPEWGTLIFNYSRNEVRSFLISNAVFWIKEYHVDGLRLDAVASMLYLDYARRPGEWIPNEYGGKENLEAVEFLKQLNWAIHEERPSAKVIAEESTAWDGVTRPVQYGGLGFDLKWNMGWMHDTLEYFSNDPIHRKYHQDKLTFSLWYAFNERFVLVLSHDEVVYGKRSMLNKMPGDEWQKFANLRLCYGYMFTHPGKKLLFMGGEFGQWSEWDFHRSLDWASASQGLHSKLSLLVKDLNKIYRESPQLSELDSSPEGFEWVDFADAQQSVIAFLRKAKSGHPLLVAANMTPVPRFGYRLGAPNQGFYREVLNTDALEYGGSGLGNLGGVWSDPTPWNDRPQSVVVTLPPLAMVVFSAEG